MKLSAIAAKLGARLDGHDAEITGVAGIEEAGKGQLTFVANPKYAAAAKSTNAAAVIVAEDFPALATPTLRSKNPYLVFAKAIELFYQAPQYAPGVDPTARIHASAKVGKNSHVGPYVIVGEDVVIGENATLLAHVVIYRGARIGSHFFA
ncbi:MAG TPA: LpxD N-terminal domain-containing protein, partial [Terriglobales bacterium]|nr:LpxD N-terminal domain-containing protein [Terriglobales bacterium]